MTAADLQNSSLGPYRLDQRIAVGGMGEVYVARRPDRPSDRPVALKVLLPHLAASAPAVQMFLAEARLAARMRHPNVVRILEVGRAAGHYYMAMELVVGVSLASLIASLRASGEQLPSSAIAFVGRALCAGLEHAHTLRGPDGRSMRVIHRDVTAHNVLVSSEGQVKLGDFGIAKARDSVSFTRPGFVKGKYEYIAPEVLRGARLDRRADLFGAGVTLYTLATRISPFRRDTERATLEALEREEATPLAELRPDLPTSLRSAIERAMHKDPARRFQSAQQLQKALRGPDADAREVLVRWVRQTGGPDLESLEGTVPAGDVGASWEAMREATLERRGWRGWARPALATALGVGAALTTMAGVRAAFDGSVQKPTVVIVPEGTAMAASLPPAPAPTSTGAASHSMSDGPAAIAKTRQSRKAPLMGYLSVEAAPWARVFVAGRPIGETPIARYPVAGGTVMVELQNPETGRAMRQRVTVVGGEETYVKADLR